jgi:hypothetical protein
MATNEFPTPANLRPAQAPTPKPSPSSAPSPAPATLAGAFRAFAGQESFTLDPDLKLALEDMCQAANGARWREAWPTWLAEMTNEGLRQMLGR